MSAHPLAMGSSGVAGVSEKNTYLNPAAVAFSENLAFEASYRKFLWGIPSEKNILGYIPPDIDEKNFKFVVPISGMAGGFGISRLSLSNAFSQNICSLYLGRSLKDIIYIDADDSENLFVGICAKYISIQYTPDSYTTTFFSRYSSEVGSFSGDAGLIYQKRNFSLGIAVKNLYPARIGVYDDTNLQSKILLGISKKFSIFKANLDTHWDGNLKKYGLSSAIEMDLQTVKLRLGANSEHLATGVGLNFGSLEFDITFIQPYLMTSSFMDVAVGVGYKFGK